MFVIMRPPYQTDVYHCQEPNGFCTKIIILAFPRHNSPLPPEAAPEQHHIKSSGKTMDLECCAVYFLFHFLAFLTTYVTTDDSVVQMYIVG